MADYDAFISYSRSASAAVVEQLHPVVERFAKPWYRKRSCRIFRDDSTMAAESSLWGTISKALMAADWLILILSPAAASSEWVNKEVALWVAHKGVDRIILVHAEGNVVWDRQRQDFSADSDALPAPLRGAFKAEPRWIDMTGLVGGEPVKGSDARLVSVAAQIAAPILGVPRDEINGRAAAEHRRTVRTAGAAIATLAVLLVAALVAGGLAYTNAEAARAQLRVATSQQLAAQSDGLLESDVALAGQLAVGAFRLDDNSQSRSALFGAAALSKDLLRSIPLPFVATITKALPDGDHLLVGGTAGRVALVGTRDGTVRELGPFPIDAPISCLDATPDGRTVVLCTRSLDRVKTAYVFREGKQVWSAEGEWDAAAIGVDGMVFIAKNEESGTVVVDRISPDAGGSKTLTSFSGPPAMELTATDDGLLMGLSTTDPGRCYVGVDPRTGQSRVMGLALVPVESYIVSRQVVHPATDIRGGRIVSLVGDSSGWALGVADDALSAADLWPNVTCDDLFEYGYEPDWTSRIGLPDKPMAIAISPGSHIVAVSDGSVVSVYVPGSTTGSEEMVASFGGIGTILAGQLFAPDESTVVTVSGATVSVFQVGVGNATVREYSILKTADALRETRCTACTPSSPLVSPKGDVVVVRVWEGSVSTWFDTATGTGASVDAEILGWISPEMAVARTPDGALVSVVGGVIQPVPADVDEAQVEALSSRAPEGTVVSGYPSDGFTVRLDGSGDILPIDSLVLPVVSPNGTMLATVSADEHLVVTSLPSGAQVARIPVARYGVSTGAIGFSQDSAMIAFDTYDFDGNSVVTTIHLDPANWQDAACRPSSGPLAGAVLQRFLSGSPLDVDTCPSR